MNTIRVLIADDSTFLRNILTEVLEQNDSIKVIGAAKNGKEAVELVKTLSPDILILDCDMPVMDGLEALKQIMAECPLPVFMFSSFTREGASVTIKALEYGAVDFLLKPSGGQQQLEAVTRELVRKIKFIVLKSKFTAVARTRPAVKPAAARSAFAGILPQRTIDIIAIGSSTGGVQAGLAIVPKLPANSKPIVWVQHMPANFTKSYAERLNQASQMRVSEGQDGELLKEGRCYLAPGGLQMRVRKKGSQYQLSIAKDERAVGHSPSCNVLFESVAEHFSSNALGIILTGMGSDGTEGLVKMHHHGAYIIGQSQESSVVYGMPKSAYEAGAVDVQLDVMDIADAVGQITGTRLPLSNNPPAGRAGK